MNGNVLTFEYQEAEAREDARFTLKGSGNAFTGRFQIRNGRRVGWDGWRPDPKAPADKLGVFAGLVLTDFGYSRSHRTTGKSMVAMQSEVTRPWKARQKGTDWTSASRAFAMNKVGLTLLSIANHWPAQANNSDFPG